MPVSETLCTRCEHGQVCKHTNEIEKLRKQVDALHSQLANKPFKADVTCNTYKYRVPAKRDFTSHKNPEIV